MYSKKTQILMTVVFSPDFPFLVYKGILLLLQQVPSFVLHEFMAKKQQNYRGSVELEDNYRATLHDAY